MVSLDVGGRLHGDISGHIDVPLDLGKVTAVVLAVTGRIRVEPGLTLVPVIHHMSEIATYGAIAITGDGGNVTTAGKTTVGDIPCAIIGVIGIVVIPVTQRLIGGKITIDIFALHLPGQAALNLFLLDEIVKLPLLGLVGIGLFATFAIADIGCRNTGIGCR